MLNRSDIFAGSVSRTSPELDDADHAHSPERRVVDSQETASRQQQSDQTHRTVPWGEADERQPDIEEYPQVDVQAETGDSGMISTPHRTSRESDNSSDQMHKLMEEKETLQTLVEDLIAKNEDLVNTCSRLRMELERGAEALADLQQTYDKVVTQRDTLATENSDLREALDVVDDIHRFDDILINGQHSSPRSLQYHRPPISRLESPNKDSVTDPNTTQDIGHLAPTSTVFPAFYPSDHGINHADIQPGSARITETMTMSEAENLQAAPGDGLAGLADIQDHSSMTCDEDIFSTPQLFHTNVTIPDQSSDGLCIQDLLDGIDTNFASTSFFPDLDLDMYNIPQHDWATSTILQPLHSNRAHDHLQEHGGHASAPAGESRHEHSGCPQRLLGMAAEPFKNVSARSAATEQEQARRHSQQRSQALPSPTSSLSFEKNLWQDIQPMSGLARRPSLSSPLSDHIDNMDTSERDDSSMQRADSATTFNAQSSTTQEVTTASSPDFELNHVTAVIRTNSPTLMSQIPGIASSIVTRVQRGTTSSSPPHFGLRSPAFTIISPSLLTDQDAVNVRGTESYRSTPGPASGQATIDFSPSLPFSKTTRGTEQDLRSHIRVRDTRRCGDETTAADSSTSKDMSGSRSQMADADPVIETDDQLKRAIIASYEDVGLSVQLNFRYGSGPFSATTIQLKTNWKHRAVLRATTWGKLQSYADELIGFFPKPGHEHTLTKEVSLVRRLCKATIMQQQNRTLKDIAFALHRDSELSRDEARLAEFEFYSTLIVMEAQSRNDFNEVISWTTDYEADLLDVFHSLHCVISSLDLTWNTLHTLVLVFLLRAGTTRLLKFFALSTRPAAIELLKQRLNNADFAYSRIGLLTSCMTDPQLANTLVCNLKSPLRRVQEHLVSFIDPTYIKSILSYEDEYADGFETSSAIAGYVATSQPVPDGSSTFTATIVNPTHVNAQDARPIPADVVVRKRKHRSHYDDEHEARNPSKRRRIQGRGCTSAGDNL